MKETKALLSTDRPRAGAELADAAVDGPGAAAGDHHPNAPYSRPAEAVRGEDKPDQLAGKLEAAENRQEALLDEAIEETFPGSDPISPKHIT